MLFLILIHHSLKLYQKNNNNIQFLMLEKVYELCCSICLFKDFKEAKITSLNKL